MATTATAVASLFAHALPNAYVLIGKRQEDGKLYPTQAVRVKDIATQLAKFKAPRGSDWYITNDVYQGGYTDQTLKIHRREEKLVSLVNVVIDVDAHGDGGKGKAAKAAFRKNRDSVLRAFASDVDAAINRGELPMYKARVATGRGLQFWFPISPLAPALVFLYRPAAIALAGAFKSLLAAKDEERAELYTSFGLDVDATASQSPTGFFRLPCSYNTKAGKRGTAKVTDAEPMSIDSLLDFLHVDTAPPQQQWTAAEGLKAGYANLYRRRLALLDWAVRRDTMGKRNTLCLLRYCTAKCLMGSQLAAQDVRKYNQRMLRPLSSKEVGKIIRNVDNAKDTGVYIFKNSTFYSLMRITEEEAEMATPIKKKTKTTARDVARAAARDARAARKAERDARIVDMARQGATYDAIAANLQAGKDTIAPIIAQAKIDTRATRKARQRERISDLLATGHTRNEVMAALKISRPTLQRRLKEIRETGNT